MRFCKIDASVTSMNCTQKANRDGITDAYTVSLFYGRDTTICSTEHCGLGGFGMAAIYNSATGAFLYYTNATVGFLELS